MLFCGRTVLFFKQLAENAERYGGLKRRAGLGDDIYIKVAVSELLQHIVERIRRKSVADEKYLGVILASDGAQKLNSASCTEIRAADAYNDERL